MSLLDLPGPAHMSLCVALRWKDCEPGIRDAMRGRAPWPGALNALRGTCRGMRDALLVTGAKFATSNYQCTVGEGDMGLAWLATSAPKLRSLDLSSRCTSSAPIIDTDRIGDMPSLVTLRLRNREIPASLQLQLQLNSQLQTLDLNGCNRLERLDMFALPITLTELDVSSGLNRITNVEWVRRLTALRSLHINAFDTAMYPKSNDMSPISALSTLTRLHLDDCCAPVLACPPSLVHLGARGCRGLRDLSALNAATGLTTLHIEGCTQVTSLASIVACTPLVRDLDVRNTGLPDLAVLRDGRWALERLACDVRTREDAGYLGAVARTLLDLDVRNCEVPCDISALTALQSLELWEPRPYDDVTFAPGALAGLTKLHMGGRSNDAVVALVGTLRSLRHLVGLSIAGVTNMLPFAHLTALSTLCLTFGYQDVDEKTPAVDMSPIATLTGLHELRVSECNLLANLAPLGALSSFTKLCVGSVFDADLASLAALTNLCDLLVVGGGQIGSLWPLTTLAALTTLHLYSFVRVRKLPRGLPRMLQHLTIVACTRVRNLGPLAALTGLRSLHMTRCAVYDLSPLMALSALSRLDVADCPVDDLAPLLAVPHLMDVRLTSMRRHVNLMPLAAMPMLRHLTLDDATRAHHTQEYLVRLVTACTGLRKGTACRYFCTCDGCGW